MGIPPVSVHLLLAHDIHCGLMCCTFWEDGIQLLSSEADSYDKIFDFYHRCGLDGGSCQRFSRVSEAQV